MILLIDNYDSFVFNLARYVEELGRPARVVRNDAVTVDDVDRLNPEAIILSPGPCTPRESGICPELIRRLGPTRPILGICLGHQTVAHALGGLVEESDQPVHGQTSQIFHAGDRLFRDIPSPFRAARYHSLLVRENRLPESLQVIARTCDGLVMGLRHREWPLVGIQFHPESVLTEHGHRLLANFLAITGQELAPPGEGDLPAAADVSDFYSRPIEPGAGPRL